MARLKSKDEILKIAHELRSKRLILKLTLVDLEQKTRINCAQISRFERGEFKFFSRNLQKLCKFLSVDIDCFNNSKQSIGDRYENFANRSQQNRAVLEELINALEKIN